MKFKKNKTTFQNISTTFCQSHFYLKYYILVLMEEILHPTDRQLIVYFICSSSIYQNLFQFAVLNLNLFIAKN